MKYKQNPPLNKPVTKESRHKLMALMRKHRAIKDELEKLRKSFKLND